MRKLVFSVVLWGGSALACSAGAKHEGAGGGGTAVATNTDSGAGGFGGDDGGGWLDVALPDGPAISADSACLTATTAAKALPARLLFQVDASGSMNCPARDVTSVTCSPSASSRWNIFHDAIGKALSGLPTTNAASLRHYPTGKGLFTGDPTGCVPAAADVAMASLATTASSIPAALAGRTPAGGTPTHDAVTVALSELSSMSGGDSRFLVLVTDGDANFCTGCDISCDSAAQATDNDAMVSAIAAAASSGVRTFVIGVPGSENFRTVLSRMAQAGGTRASASCSDSGPVYCHYDMTTAADLGAALKTALSTIGTAALSCSYPLPPADGSFDPKKVNVELTSGGGTKELARDTSHADGWDYSADGKSIVLYGGACDAAKSTTDGSISLLFGCPTVVK